MDYPPVVVSPLWVEESIKAGRRLVERKYLVKKPTESLLGRTPGTAGAAKKRKRPAAAPLPKPAEAYDIDDLNFSSTQQIQGQGGQDEAAVVPSGTAVGDGEVTSPRGGAPAKQQRGAAGRGAKKQQARGMPTVVELLSDDEEEGWQQEEPQQGAPPPLQQAGKIGTETQAVSGWLVLAMLPVHSCSSPALHTGVLACIHRIPVRYWALHRGLCLPAGGQHPHNRPARRLPPGPHAGRRQRWHWRRRGGRGG